MLDSNADTDADLNIYRMEISLSEADPQKRFPQFYQGFRAKYRTAYNPRTPYCDTEVAPVEITNQMSTVIAGPDDVSTTIFRQIVMCGDSKLLQPRRPPQSELTRLSRNPQSTQHALVKLLNGPEKLKNERQKETIVLRTSRAGPEPLKNDSRQRNIDSPSDGTSRPKACRSGIGNGKPATN